MSRNFYTPKQVETHVKYHMENVLLVVLATLCDKYKFNHDKLREFSKDVQEGGQFVTDLRISRTELLDIIAKHGEV